MMKSVSEIQDILNHASGTTRYHRFSRIPGFPIITDGVQALAEAAECYWLLDVIGSYQTNRKLDKRFQVWEMTVNDDNSAKVYGYNDDVLIITQRIEATDFPLKKIKFYLIDGVILLPSEY